MPMQSLEDLFVDKLKDIYDAERRITKALPKLAKAASSEELSAAFEEHQQQTEDQIERLDRIFESLGKSPGRKPCHGMMGILEEGQEVMQEDDAPEAVMDAALIASAQEVEHYEIGAYGCLRTWAELLGMNEEATLLQQSLDEEEAADRKLSELSNSINQEALQAAEGGEGEEGENEEMEMAGAARGRSQSGSGSTSREKSAGAGGRQGGGTSGARRTGHDARSSSKSRSR